MKPFLFAAMLAFAAFSTVRGATNLVVNGDFESPCGGSEFWTFQQGDTFDGWLVTTGSVDVVKEPVWGAASGAQSVDLDGRDRGAFAQTLQTTPGLGYVLSFSLAGNPDTSSTWPSTVRTMNLRWDGVLVDTLVFDTAGHTREDPGWEYHSYQVSASQDSTLLEFESLTEGPYGPMIDDVVVRAIPEPATWLLMAGGLLALGRRRF